MGHFFSLITESADKTAQTNEGIIEEEFAEGQQGEHKVEGQVKLLVQLHYQALEIGEGHF